MRSGARWDDIPAKFADRAELVLHEVIDAAHARRLDEPTRDLMSLLLLDSLGCLYYSSSQNSLHGLFIALADDEPGDVPLWGLEVKSSLRTAAMAAGGMIHGFEFDDQCIGAGLHAGAAVLPGPLALLSRRGMSGEHLLRAMVVGTEVGITLGRILGGGPSDRGFHIHCWTGAAASAAASAFALGLDAESTVAAVRLALSCAGGFVSAQHDAATKKLQAGRAAEAGLIGALLAARGTGGLKNVISRPDGGVLTSVGGLDEEEIAMRCDRIDPSRSQIADVLAFKSIPGKISIQSAYASLDALLQDIDPRSGALERISVIGPEHLIRRVGHLYVPGDSQSAQASLRFMLASRVFFGPVSVDSFSPEALCNTESIRFANDKIDLEIVDGQDDVTHQSAWNVQMEIVTADGNSLSIGDVPTPGFPDHRDADWIVEKFAQLAARRWPAQEVKEMASSILAISSCADAREALRAPSPT